MDRNRFLYLDHAATTFPRPPEVLSRMLSEYARMGCSPGRGGYDMAEDALNFVQRVRERLAVFFECEAPNRVVFTANATDALNMGIFGLLQPGMHVVTTRLEHNSVLRPLYHLRQRGDIDYTFLDFDGYGFVNPDDIAKSFRKNTGLVVINHASNVLGTVQPIEDIGRICTERNILLLMDAAQSAGHVPIKMGTWHISAVAFTGHKALMGPSGIGGLIIAPGVEISPTRFGGTGIHSQSLKQPASFPHRLEAGTLNLLGIIGLNAGLDYLEMMDMNKHYARKMALLGRLRTGLLETRDVHVYGSISRNQHVPLLSFGLAGIHPNDAGMILDGDFDIAVRTGIHCAPLLHESLGTAPDGAVRVSLGWSTTTEDVDRFLAAILEIMHSK